VEHLTISLFLTRRCSSRCRHCGAWSTPWGEKDFTKEGTSRAVAEIQKTPAIGAVGLSGGEVFVAKELFYHAVDELRRVRLPYTFVTNAFWAKSPKKAREVLGGVSDTIGMGLSADSFHQEFIPLDRVVNAARAADDLGIPYLIRVTMRSRDREDEMVRWLVDAGVPRADVIRCAPVMYIGQARQHIPPDDFPDDNPPAPCLSLRTPFLFSDGSLIACCGEGGNIPGKHPLYLGNIYKEELKTLIGRYETDPFLRALYEKGPRWLWELLGEEPAGERERLLLRSPCGTCRLVFEDEERTKRLKRILAHKS
jgi:hypothetical protein